MTQPSKCDVSRSAAIWTEDECTKGTDGHERTPDAWVRIFGCSIEDEVTVHVYDFGDSFLELYESGRIEGHDHTGGSILLLGLRELPSMAERAQRLLRGTRE